MGVPALFRWLSKKYPRIVASVEEEEPRKVPGADGEDEELPIDMSGPNPGGEENDCLYLDMNGIVHPCTHPEGKPAPETEEDMMVEIFSYTERVVNMVRPRKLLMMAIDGVAPRAKMNQQRSRRFRSAQEAQEKHEEQLAALAEWKSMGLPVTDEAMAVKKAWDSNAITPGTPFMFLLAASLRYWVTKKLNTDPGWKDLKVIISDASVPGEGEHKIMDYIRRQRSHPSHDPNTRHVIYGLDADLIMLSLATHEPYFKVLREDVFAQDSKSNACHRCGGQGHIAANCIGEPKAKKGPQDAGGEKTVSEKKPFIYLDVSILREYLEVELDVPNLPFGFDLERALDDWVFLIFFVGNDFLPHLPSLEIREGAIDQLLTIWKAELPRSGGYLTNHGRVEMKHAQVILEGLAAHEDDIFRRRKEQEERQEANQKRRKDEEERRQRRARGERETPPERDSGPAALEDGLVPVVQPASAPASLSKEEAMKKMLEPVTPKDAAAARKANLIAAAKLRAELAGKNGIASDPQVEEVKKVADGGAKVEAQESNAIVEDGDEVKPAESNGHINGADAIVEDDEKPATNGQPATELEAALFPTDEELEKDVVSGRKRTHDEAEAEDAVIAEDVDDTIGAAEDEDEGNETVDPVLTKTRTVKADGTVEYEDTVKLWEPGYRERYYRQKFGVELSDVEFRRKVVKAYVEGLCWVLAYYYQGCPSWTWYYPYHYSPFAADFTELETLDITFEVGTPFKPFEQLMGVFPAASRVHVPEIFHPLMIEPDSEIIEYYPTEFEIDMNGKKMAWQGVALLPFIDEKRLLKAVAPHYPSLDEEQTKRNTFGSDALFVSEKSSLYDHLCALYAKRKNTEPIAIDPKLSNGMTGWVRPDPDCVPGSTFASPLTSVQLADIRNDRALSVLYDVPEQTTPHRSVLLKGLKPPPRKLTEGDKDWTRRGGPDSRGRGRGRGRGGHGPGVTHAGMRMGSGPMNGGGGGYQNGGGSRGAYDFGASHNAYSSSAPSSYQQYGGPPQHSRPYEQTSYGAGGGYGQQAPYQQPAYTGGSMSAYGNGGGAYQGSRGAYGGQYGGPPSGGHGGSYGGGQGAYGGGGYGSSAYGNQPPSANGGGYSYGGGAYGSGAGAYGGAAQGAYGGAGGGAYGSYGGQQGYQQPYGGGGYGGGSYGGRQSGPPPPLGRGGAQPPRGGGRY